MSDRTLSIYPGAERVPQPLLQYVGENFDTLDSTSLFHDARADPSFIDGPASRSHSIALRNEIVKSMK